jgi:hypothetical protein
VKWPPVFDRSTGREVWAALLRLADGASFVDAARRLRWSFDPPGMDNTEPVDRFGASILPWLADHVLDGGVLVNTPWCIAPCLVALDDPRAFDLLWRTTRITRSTRRGGLLLDGKTRSPSALGLRGGRTGPHVEKLVDDWIAAHPERARDELARRVDEPRARRKLARLAPATLDERAILDVLDGCADGAVETDGPAWPLFCTNTDGRWEYHALRLIAARAARGPDWGLLLERITGCEDGASIQRYTYGNAVGPGLRVGERSFVDLEIDGDQVRGAKGKLRVTSELIRKHDLRPGWCIEKGTAAAFALGIRAYLARFPDGLWKPAKRAIACLGLRSPRIIVESRAFEHVLGKGQGKWRRSPSRSTAYRSLARALVASDGKHFVPGPSNLDWRLHVRTREPL